ncbi:MAG: tyrosine-type recombinase/integrase [Deferrisomatales bacterium]
MAGSVKWQTSKKYPGIRWYEGSKGKVFYVVYKVKGKATWEKVGGTWEGYNLETAKTVRANRIKTIRHGEELPQDPNDIPTFGEVAKKYLAWSKAHKKSWKDDKVRYENHLEPELGATRVDAIRPLDLERIKKNLREKKKSPATIQQALACFRAIFNKGKEWGLIRCENPMKTGRVKMPKVDNARERLLSHEEVMNLLADLEQRSLQAYELALLAYHTGARRGELFALKWGDVDLNPPNPSVVFRHTKNGRTRRIPLNDEALALLTSKRDVLTEEREGALPSPSEPVISTSQGSHLRNTTTALQRTMNRMFNEGVTDRRHRVVFHSLRHAFASRLVAAGTPLNVVKKLTGHQTLAMLERYSHLMPNAEKDALKILARPPQAVEPPATPVAEAS